MPPEPIRKQLLHYVDSTGIDRFGEWLESIEDSTTRAAVAARLIRLELGLFGDTKPLGSGVSELRIHQGAGWRVFFSLQGASVILLLAGSSKGTQAREIKVARQRLKEWLNRSSV
jgi:putative addiction module killer protein